MDFLLVTGIGILAGGIALLWWRLRSLAHKVEHVTRQEYYQQSELRETARRQSESLAVLRVQVAQLASGNALDGTLIQTGNLYHRIGADEARQMVERHAAATQTDLIIVDVRSQKEFLAGHIPGAIHIPFEQVETRFQADIPRETRKIFVYCSQGERSRLACDFLSREGYTTLVTMPEGFQRWTGPVLGTGSPELVHIQSRTLHASSPSPTPAPSHVASEKGQHPHG